MVENDHYYFVSYSSQNSVATEWAFPLARLKQFFDQCDANRVLVYLDFCHSGGVIPRDASETSVDAREIFQRDITISGGTGKMIYAACTEKQSAYEDTAEQHGFFTKAVAEGLAGAAVNTHGEVTSNSLHDFVSSKLDALNLSQQPMQFGHMAGRLILRQHSDRFSAPTNIQQPHNFLGNHPLEIDDSGNLCMLGDYFLEAAELTKSNDIVILTNDSIESIASAEIENLRGLAGRQIPIKFSHQNKCFHVYLLDITTNYRDNTESCSIKLKELPWQHNARSETAYSENGRTFTPLDIAVIGARKVLLNEDLGHEQHEPGKGHVNSYMPISALLGANYDEYRDSCSLETLRERFELDQSMWLKAARLQSIYSLRNLGLADQISSLKFVKTDDSKVHVTFKGKRPKYFQNIDPESISVIGDYIL